MKEKRNHLDIIIIGAGLSVIVFLKYAKDYNYNCLVPEKQDDVDGLRKKLPPGKWMRYFPFTIPWK